MCVCVMCVRVCDVCVMCVRVCDVCACVIFSIGIVKVDFMNLQNK